MQKTAIVTGAARGIGLATTDTFLPDDWRVAMVDWDADELNTVKRENTIALPHDISNPQDASATMRETLAAFGRIDALVNNAGIADFGPIEETDFERWRRVMAVNLDGTFLLSQAATPSLKKTQSPILNIASISGPRPSPPRVAFGTSHAAATPPTRTHAGAHSG